MDLASRSPWICGLSRLRLISEDKLRRGTGYRVRLHTRDSNIDGNSGTWLQPLGLDALNNGERLNSYYCLVRVSVLSHE
jgi:hypothetical protein